jgi:serine/threonine-protein kinase
MFMRRYEAVVSAQSAQVYEFGNYRLDMTKRLLLGGGGNPGDASTAWTPVSLTPKAFDTLVYLVEHGGAVLGKDELMRAIWPDTVVEENNLNQNISLLRRALGDDSREHRYIATVPGRGYQFVASVRVAAGTAESKGPAEPSIAVLPFLNLSADPANDYFCDGLAEDLINALSRLEQLRVAARTSASFFKGRHADVREIGQKLNVSTVLEGSVRRSGNRLRITAQLINASSGYHLWSERFDRETEMRDVFDLQDEITLAVVNALELKLLGEEKSALLKHHTGNIRAYELYLKGRFHLFKAMPAEIQTGISFFERAIQLDSSYALAHVGLAHAYRLSVLALDVEPIGAFAKAKAAALKAIAIDDNLAEAHVALGFILLWHDLDWNAAARQVQRSLELNRHSADTHWLYGRLLSVKGRHQEALAEIERARQLDPLSPVINASEGLYLLYAGRGEEALTRLRETVELDPSSLLARLFLIRALIARGMFAEAIAEAQTLQAMNPDDSMPIAFAGFAQAKSGQQGAARATLKKLLQLSSRRYVPPYCIAMIYNGLSERDEALAWLERGFEQRDPRMTILREDFTWSNLRDDPGFLSLLKRMNLQ